jgi:hypothetical protein
MRENITLNFNPIQILGYLSCKLPSDVFSTIQEEVYDILKTNFSGATAFNNYLAGSIQHEYGLYRSVDVLNKFMKKVVPEYWQFVNEHDKCNIPLNITKKNGDGLPSLWVNYQKKYEYNPLHDHSGILSFVVFVKIPYTLTDEERLPSIANSNNKDSIPHFSFVYPSHPNTHSDPRYKPVAEHNINVDKSYEGTLILFPSWLQHCVTPFYTSNEYRITVAGNLYLE